jgi:hypothetical protein
MIDDEKGKLLHHRFTLGETLTAEEQAQLSAWYTAIDEAEAELLNQPQEAVDLEALQNQIDVSSAQLLAVTERISQVTHENNVIRQENSRLRQQLVNRTQPA